MNKLIELLNQNEGAMSAVLSALSLLVAIIAIWISISSANSQQRLQLFEERYKIYELFSSLVEKAELLSHPSLSYKGHLMMWNSTFFDSNEKICVEGLKAQMCDELVMKISPEEENFEQLKEKISTSKKEFLDSRSTEAYKMFIGQKTRLRMSHLLFEKEIYETIDSFVDIYWDAILHVGYDELETEKLLKNWYELSCRIKQEKILEKMEKKMQFHK